MHRARLWQPPPFKPHLLRRWRSEALGALAVLVLAALFVGVLLTSVAQAARRHAGLDATQQQRLACERLAKPAERRACVAATAANQAPERLAASR